MLVSKYYLLSYESHDKKNFHLFKELGNFSVVHALVKIKKLRNLGAVIPLMFWKLDEEDIPKTLDLEIYNHDEVYESKLDDVRDIEEALYSPYKAKGE